MTTHPSAVLWDMDGTIVDSEPYWIEEERALMGEHDIPWTHEDAMQFVGMSLPISAVRMRDIGDLPYSPEQIIERLVSGVARRMRQEVPWRPGARELLHALREARVPMALVTMSYRPVADAMLEAIGVPYFDLIVTGEDVARGKPYPDPYLQAAAGLGVDVHTAVAIEDSANGLASALAAGAPTLVVPNVVHIDPSDRYSMAASLTLVTVAHLAAISAGERMMVHHDPD